MIPSEMIYFLYYYFKINVYILKTYNNFYFYFYLYFDLNIFSLNYF